MKTREWEQIVFTTDRYNGDRDAMYSAIGSQLKLLMDNDYTCKIFDDAQDIIVIQYDHDNRRDDWGGPYLEWLTEEELELILSNRDELAGE